MQYPRPSFIIAKDCLQVRPTFWDKKMRQLGTDEAKLKLITVHSLLANCVFSRFLERKFSPL